MMTVCKLCLYDSHHPLNITFNEEGICSGCLVHFEKDELDWENRAKMLGNILSDYRSKSGTNYDCIVPVSGARDSHFITHVIKNKYNMNPLLVSYNKQYNTAVGTRNLANLRMKFDCDIFTQTINPEKVKQITRSTLRRFGSCYWHCLAGETVFPVQVAVRLKIPLIVWGAHQGIDQVGMFSHSDEVEMTRKYRKEHDLMGFEAEDLEGDMEHLTSDHLSPFFYPEDYFISRVGVRGIYLNNYIRWDTKAQHEKMITTYDYETRKANRTFDNYNDVDSFVYGDVHDLTKELKHGYSKVLDHACREIRLGRITREQARSLVNIYGANPPVNIDLFTNWLGISASGLRFILDEIRNPKIWYRDENWQWKRRQTEPTAQSSSATSRSIDTKVRFDLTRQYNSSDKQNSYVLIGKGNRQ